LREEEDGWMVSENIAPRRIFGPERKDATEWWRNFHDED
jgi:hypothetical protein